MGGESIFDIRDHERHTRWPSGPELHGELADRAADPALRQELDELAGETLEGLEAPDKTR